MSYSIRSLIVVIVALIGASPLSAQDSTAVDSVYPASRVQVLARYTNGQGVTLRWAPDRQDGWNQGNRHGYRIERLEIGESGEPRAEQATVLVDTLRPLGKAAWIARAKADQDARFFWAALQCIHGDWETAGLGIGVLGAIQRGDELRNRYSFCLYSADLDAEAAEAAALRYVDASAKPGVGYVYWVSVNAPERWTLPAREGAVTIWTRPSESPPPVLAKAAEHEGYVSIQWPRTYDEHYTAFWVERATATGPWARLDSIPYIHGRTDDEALWVPFMSYPDSVRNYVPYRYRVIGIDAFGEESRPGEAITAMGRDRTPPPKPHELRSDHLDGQHIVLNWKQEPANDISHYNVYRGYAMSEPLTLLAERLPADTRRYFDETYHPLMKNYYLLQVVDTAGNTIMSDPVYGMVWDSTRPEPPTNLRATVDTNGIVTLQWDASPNVDVIGYKVLMANSLEHEFSLLTGEHIRGRLFVDTIELKTSTAYIYYRIMAVDHMYNYSELSAPLAVKRPDIIKPNSPVWQDYEVTDGRIILRWTPSRSNDVKEHRLYRTPTGGRENLLIIGNPLAEGYTDSLLQAGKGYTYRLEAIDSSGLHSIAIQDLVPRGTSGGAGVGGGGARHRRGERLAES